MIYFNYAGLGRERPESKEKTRMVQAQFEELLFSESGVQWYATQLENCKRILQQLLGLSKTCSTDNILFVPNATTAFQVILSDLVFNKGDVLLTSDQEHPSIIRSLFRLKKKGVELKAINATSEDEFCEKLQESCVKYNARMLLLSHVAYTDGRIFPLRRACEIAKQNGLIVVIDGAQAVGHIPVDLKDLSIDFYFFSGHKWCCGPMGTGAFYISDNYLGRSQIKLDLLEIGTIKKYFDVGTQNVGLISGLATACALRIEELPAMVHRLSALQSLLKKLSSSLQGAHICQWVGEHAPGIITIRLESDMVNPSQLTAYLFDEHDMVIKPFAYPEQPGIARISYLPQTTEEDIRNLIGRLQDSLWHFTRSGKD